jgi:hypothetical protein
MHFQEKKKHFKKQHLPLSQIPLRTIWNCIPNGVSLNFELFCFCLKIFFFYDFRSFWYCDVKNNFLKIKKYIYYFNTFMSKKYFKKQLVLHSQIPSYFYSFTPSIAIKGVFRRMITVAVQNLFYLEMHQNNIFILF